MFADIEKNPRRVLVVSGLFALIGVLALALVLMQSPSERDPGSEFNELFGKDLEEERMAKHVILDELSASKAEESSVPSTQEKFDVLKSLRAQ